MAHAHSPGFLALVHEAKKRTREISIADVRKRLQAGEPLTLVDVREDREWDAYRIGGATHIGKGVIERDIESRVPDHDAPIICYCGGGFRSALVCDNLQKMGYTNALSMEGGIRGWIEQGLPVEEEEA